ncbi:MAG: methionine synthase [Actinobacteria bacterium]|nr:methionine synthase [Actinomycetota bacterium]
MSSFLEALQERVVIFDGAMGTSIHASQVSIDDYNGQEGNSEVLTFTRPEVIQSIHAGFLDVGCEVVETNTFGANVAAQGEYGQADKVYDLNLTAAKLAKEVASSYSDRTRWVFGSIGPGTKLPTLGDIDFDTLADGYEIQVRGLIDGGADGLIIETCFDLLQTKAAIAGAMDAFTASSTKLPLIVQVTIQPEGAMLLGSEIGAALATIDPFRVVDVIGINCSTGPVEMTEHVRYLCNHSRRPVSVQPNMGIPDVVAGVEHFPLTPEEFVRHHRIFVEEFGASVIGGCCGSTPEHMGQLVEALRDMPRPDREVRFEPASSSLYIAQPFQQDTSVFVIGERLNTQGSRKFKALVENQDFEGIVDLAKEQIREGCHALDVMPDITGRNGAEDISAIVSRLATQSTLPLVIDSTEWPVMEAALKKIGGRPVMNSVNLEDGAGPDSSFAKKMQLAVRFGAAVVAGAIEEKGQATTADWKVEVCGKLHKEVLSWGLEPHDILWDPLVLPISTGQEEARPYALETLDAIERLKDKFPGTFTTAGVSNISFGLSPVARKVLNSVFLHEAINRGLDSAIVHYGKILPMSRIPDDQKEAALDLIYDRRREGYDPLTEFMARFEGVESEIAQKEDLISLPLEERLNKRIIDGNRTGLTDDLDEAMAKYDPLKIINDFLLEGMKVVGDLFGSGQMQLPFVLQSAETMKAAVAHLEPHMEKATDGGKGKIVLATVRGDVHDIGKNLVDIILTNNGYTVFNLGIRQPIGSIIEAAQREKADAIGLSGLLVKSTIVMREDLEELNRRDLHHYPVLLGGAALSRSYVEDDLRQLYRGEVFYGRDAFEGLNTMDSLMAAKREGSTVSLDTAPKPKRQKPAKTQSITVPSRSDVATDAPIPTPPFFGSRIVKGIPIADVARFLNREVALFRGQWGYKRRRGQSADDYREYLRTEVEPILRQWMDRVIEEQILQPAVAYGYFNAQSEGNDLIIFHDDGKEWLRFTFPRQTSGKFLCISDFFRPVGSKEMDVVAFHLVTMGPRVSEVAQELFQSDRYNDYLHLHGLSVEMAEALAEMWHMRIRQEMGIAEKDASDIKGLFKQGYRGSRYSFGYPACPDLEDQVQIMELLEPERIGVTLSEEFQLHPEQSTSAIIAHHPEARYFSVARSPES